MDATPTLRTVDAAPPAPAPPARRFPRRFPTASGPILEAPRAVADVQQRDRRYRRALACSDLGAVGLMLLAAAAIGGASLRFPALALLPAVVLVAKCTGLYDRDELLINKTTIDEAPQLFQVATLLAFSLVLTAPRVIGADLPVHGAVALWAGVFAMLVLMRRATRSALKRSVPVERCVLVGDTAAFNRLQDKLEGSANAELVGRMCPPPGGDVAHDLALRDLIDQARAHRVVIDPQALPDREMLSLVRTAKGLGVRVSLLPSVHDVVGSEVVFDQLQGMTLLGVRRFGLSRSSLALKRTFDLLVGSLMTVVAAPPMLLIALAIKLDSPGPVFFRQTRVGRDGRHFQIFKFRTMVADAESRKSQLLDRNEADGLFKIADDPRITRVGRVLRRTSLDELAQLLNVLRGDMSLVGPRPLVVHEDALITGSDRGRLQLTPGMTGHWQIAGSARIPMHEMVKIDYLYVAGWSLWSDVKILLRTLPYMAARRGM